MKNRISCIFGTLMVLSFSVSSKILDTLFVEGLVVHNPAVVYNNVNLPRGKEFTSIELQDAIKNLSSLGFFRLIDFYIVEETDTSVSMLLKLEEYPVCEAIEYSGNKKLKKKDFEEKLIIKPGHVASSAALHDNINILKEIYAEKGYLLADISCELIETKIPGNVIVKFNIDEGKRVRVKEIVFAGNTEFTSRKLKRKLKTKENKWFASGEFNEDEYKANLDTLLMFYYDKGYLDANIVEDSVWYSENNKDIYIKISIEEGKKYHVGDFYFTGNKVIKKDVLSSQVGMKKGKPFQKNKFEMVKALISNAYREEGYLWVQVKEQFQYKQDTIDVVFDIVEGRAAIVRKVDVQGNYKTFEKVVRRELRLYPGQKYKQSRMERSIREVMALNYFNNVTPDLRPNEDGTIDLIFKVEEKENIGQFSAGVVYSQLEGFGGNFSITIPNFRGRGQELSAKVDLLTYSQSFSLSFTEPWFLDNPTSVSGSIFYSKYRYLGTMHDVIESYGFRLGAGKRLKWPDDYFSVFASYQLSREEEWSTGKTIKMFEILDKAYLSKWTFKLDRNDTDIPNFPNRGSIFSLTCDVAGLGGIDINSDRLHNYLKGIVSYNWYFPLLWKFVIGMKSEFGILGGLGKKPSISRYDLFSAGGVYYGGQIRGYPEETFGGRYHMDEGTTMLTFSTEIRFPILEQQLYFGIFSDMGNTWGELADVDITDVYKGVGCGIRLLFPMIGLLGFDLGWPLDDPRGSHFKEKMGGAPEFHFLMNRGF